MNDAAEHRSFSLKSVAFRREREKSWHELETLLQRIDKSGLAGLTTRELTRLVTLYRAAMSSLSVARAISLDLNLTEYLESLCARAYFRVYGTKRPVREVILHFLCVAFPCLVRRHWRPLLIAAAFLVCGSVTAYHLVLADQELYYSFVHEGLAGDRTPLASTESLRDALYDEAEDDSLAAFASFLFSHNSQVGLLAFSLGFLAGLPSVLLMFTNGLMLGAFSALYESRNLSFELWAWLLPHGITELTAIVLAGGGGLMLAQALVFPGPYRRLEALARRGVEAGQILVGAMLMLAIAGMVEGFFRQMVQDVTVRYTVATTSLLFWTWYFGFVGRGREP